jgi:hypothetical protein
MIFLKLTAPDGKTKRLIQADHIIEIVPNIGKSYNDRSECVLILANGTSRAVMETAEQIEKVLGAAVRAPGQTV